MREKLTALCLVALLVLGLTACGSAGAASAQQSAADASAQQSADLANEGETLDNLPVYPGTVGPLPSETEKNPALEALIAKTWDIPEDAWADTWYLYNYVDLDGDGADELFAAVLGSYTSGTGGDSGLIADMGEDGSLTLRQTFTLLREPVIVSDAVTNGWHDLITAQLGGGAEACYRILRADADGKYPNVNDGEAVGDGTDPATLGDVSGTAVLYNDLMTDRDVGTALSLGK